MALIHQMLYQTENIASIKFHEYLEQLSSSLASMYKGSREISCEVSAGDISLDIDTAIPLGLIINELVSNAYKYAFAERASGKISIELHHSEESYTLLVSDDGIGMPENAAQGNSSSLGIRLVNILTSQLNGKLEMGKGDGTSFIIKFEETR